MRAKHAKLVLQVRDFEILKTIFEHKIVDFHFIKEKFFNFSSPIANRRMQKLAKYELVEKQAISEKDRFLICYSLTDLGKSAVKDQYEHTITGNKIKSDSPLHDLVLIRIREKLSRHKGIHFYITENILANCESIKSSNTMKPFYGVYPDAVMSINHDGNKPIFGIEYENSIQNVSKYQSKIEKYLKKDGISAVLFVANHDKSIENLKIAYEEINPSRSCIFYATLRENFEKSQEKICFYNLENNEELRINISKVRNK